MEATCRPGCVGRVWHSLSNFHEFPSPDAPRTPCSRMFQKLHHVDMIDRSVTCRRRGWAESGKLLIRFRLPGDRDPPPESLLTPRKFQAIQELRVRTGVKDQILEHKTLLVQRRLRGEPGRGPTWMVAGMSRSSGLTDTLPRIT